MQWACVFWEESENPEKPHSGAVRISSEPPMHQVQDRTGNPGAVKWLLAVPPCSLNEHEVQFHLFVTKLGWEKNVCMLYGQKIMNTSVYPLSVQPIEDLLIVPSSGKAFR